METRSETMTTTLPSRNTEWGFHGTIGRNHPAADPAEAWEIASRAIAEATGASLEGVRDFLDSSQGRHFADDVTNSLNAGLALEPAIAAAVTRWMGWCIDRETSRETGIPQDLPYLTGWANHFAIMAELPY
jgi:hypothetical protein